MKSFLEFLCEDIQLHKTMKTMMPVVNQTLLSKLLNKLPQKDIDWQTVEIKKLTQKQMDKIINENPKNARQTGIFLYKATFGELTKPYEIETWGNSLPPTVGAIVAGRLFDISHGNLEDRGQLKRFPENVTYEIAYEVKHQKLLHKSSPLDLYKQTWKYQHIKNKVKDSDFINALYKSPETKDIMKELGELKDFLIMPTDKWFKEHKYSTATNGVNAVKLLMRPKHQDIIELLQQLSNMFELPEHNHEQSLIMKHLFPNYHRIDGFGITTIDNLIQSIKKDGFVFMNDKGFEQFAKRMKADYDKYTYKGD